MVVAYPRPQSHRGCCVSARAILIYLPSVYPFFFLCVPSLTTPFLSLLQMPLQWFPVATIPSKQFSFLFLSHNPAVSPFQEWDKCDWFCMCSVCRVWGCSDGSNWGSFVRLWRVSILVCCKAWPKKPHSFTKSSTVFCFFSLLFCFSFFVDWSWFFFFTHLQFKMFCGVSILSYWYSYFFVSGSLHF